MGKTYKQNDDFMYKKRKEIKKSNKRSYFDVDYESSSVHRKKHVPDSPFNKK